MTEMTTTPTTSEVIRQDLVKNAVTFLKDPTIQSSPVEKRIEFLHAKGLTSAEIDEATRQAATASSSSSSTSSTINNGPYPVRPFVSQQYAYAPQPVPLVPRLDWRDYFVMAVVSGGVMFGLVSLARKYLWPHMQPPSATAYEADRDALTAQFDAVASLVAEMHAESAAARKAADTQRADIERATNDVEDAIRELRIMESKAENDLREIRLEVDAVKEMLPKMMDKTRDAQTQSIAELRTELASLKSLLLTLGPSSTPTTSMPSIPPVSRPTIPAWQLAGGTRSTSPATPNVSGSSTSGAYNASNGSYGKAPEREDGGMSS